VDTQATGIAWVFIVPEDGCSKVGIELAVSFLLNCLADAIAL
jgi:hypothetical protein